MGETKEYKLYITDDGSEKFLDWRKRINGTTDSNMTKIEDALNEKASHSKEVQGVLLASAWDGTKAPYTQEIIVSGLRHAQNGNISIGQSATHAQRLAARSASLSVTGQTDGKLIITADGSKPSVDIPVVTVLLD